VRLVWVEGCLVLVVAVIAISNGLQVMVLNSSKFGAREAGGYVVLIGLLLIFLAAVHLMQSYKRGGGPSVNWGPGGTIHWIPITIGLFAGYVLMMDYLGYMVSTAIFLVACLRVFGTYPWVPVIVSSSVVSLGLTYLWEELGLVLPRSILPWF
jgi:hypothetical protein